MTGSVPINIVLEGGGAKGIAYVGALQALEKRTDIRVRAVAGASAGAITALLVAAGYESRELKALLPEALKHLSAQMPRDVDGWRAIVEQRAVFRGLLTRLQGEGNALDNAGLRSWLGERLAEKLGEKDGTKVTFSELYGKSGIELYVVAADVSEARLITFHHAITPDCEVVDAVLASSAIPGALPVGKLIVSEPGLAEPNRVHTLVDGGVWANFPDFVFKDASFREYWQLGPVEGAVIGFLLHETPHECTHLAASPHPPEADDVARWASEKSVRFGTSEQRKGLYRHEARLEAGGTELEQADAPKRSLAGRFLLAVKELVCDIKALLFTTAFLSLLASCTGAVVYEPVRKPALILSVELISIAVLIWGWLVLPQSSQSLKSNEHGWPRNKLTNVADLLLTFLSQWPVMLAVWAVLIVALAFAVSRLPEISRLEALLIWILGIGFAVLLCGNLVALGALALSSRGLRDWGWGVSHTFLVSSGAPRWRGRAADDLIVYLPIPREVSTLSFAIHENRKLMECVDAISLRAAEAQLGEILEKVRPGSASNSIAR